MKVATLFGAVFSILALFICGCGSSSGGSGMNGGITVTAVQTGSVVKATATYTNPTQSNLVGVAIDFSVQIGNQTISLGTSHTNNSGVAEAAFTPPAFSGSQTITVIAKTGGLTDFAPLIMTGNTLSVTPPPTLALTTTAPGGTAVPFTLPPTANFVTITDPFTNNISGHLITVSAAVVSGNAADTLNPPNATTTGSGGTSPFPGATGTLITPTTVGGVDTMTITWTVTDTVTGQTGTAITTITLTKSS